MKNSWGSYIVHSWKDYSNQSISTYQSIRIHLRCYRTYERSRRGPALNLFTASWGGKRSAVEKIAKISEPGRAQLNVGLYSLQQKYSREFRRKREVKIITDIYWALTMCQALRKHLPGISLTINSHNAIKGVLFSFPFYKWGTGA